MVFTLSTSHEIGLAVVGGLFISFALLSSFFFPRFRADFPTGKGLRWYLPLSFLFFIAMLGAVLVFGKEQRLQRRGSPPGWTHPPTPTGTRSRARPCSRPPAASRAIPSPRQPAPGRSAPTST